MKNFLIVMFIIMHCVVFGQLQKGNLLIGGSAGFYNSNGKGANSPTQYSSKSTTLDLNPRIGFFLSNHSVVGLEPGYSFAKDSYGNSGVAPTKGERSSFSIKPFYRYYFPLGEKAAFYLHGRAGIAFSKVRQDYYYLNETTGEVIYEKQKSDVVTNDVSISPGIAFFVIPQLSIETMISSLGYQYAKQKPETGGKATSQVFNFNHNVFNFGLTWYLIK